MAQNESQILAMALARYERSRLRNAVVAASWAYTIQPGVSRSAHSSGTRTRDAPVRGPGGHATKLRHA